MHLQNPRTTLAGYVLALGALAFIGMHVWQGNLSINDIFALGGIVAGTGLVNSADGGH